MTKIRSMLVDQSIMGGPERRGDERSEAPRSGGSPIIDWSTSIDRILVINVLTPPRPQH